MIELIDQPRVSDIATATCGAVHQRWYARALAAGCGWFGVLALLRTRRMADIIGADERAVRLLGLRDLGSALLLVTARNPRPAIVVRVLCDVSDAVRFTRRRPVIGAVAAVYATLGALALRSGRSPKPAAGDERSPFQVGV